ncbi:unnamed protein product [Trifolium pratense]|uniref:Uncharacterized protein n=1 Tax=Trifolium pratense TaxID=57577 RepID=A0ACB0KEL3_TRIPR|nr:unnamed protein product [Trifolium pratense]
MSESSHSNSDTNGRTTSPVHHDSGKAKPSSSSGVSKMEFHPALAVSNIKNHIPIVLEIEKDQYGTWAELFRIHARSTRVLHHIVPSTGKTPPAPTDVEHEQWTTLDAVVLQWIYSTISTDLLTTILEPNSTAMEAWNRLKDIFEDNKNARAVTLEQEFSNTRMEDFPNVSAYVATFIRQKDPLPKFPQARSMLILEEAGMAKMANTGSHSALHTTQQRPSEETSQRGNRRSGNRSRSRGNQGRGGGRANRSGPQSGAPSAPPPWSSPSWQQQPQYAAWQPWGWTPPPWALPPCPYPTAQWTRPTGPPKQQPGILGQRPQAYAATTSSQIPTDIEAAMHTMSLHTPDNQWYMDTGATSHTAASRDGDPSHEM